MAINDKFGDPTELADLGAFITNGFDGNGPVLETVVVKCCEPLAKAGLDAQAQLDPQKVAQAQVQKLAALKDAFPIADRAKLKFMSAGFGTYPRDDTRQLPPRFKKDEPKCGDSLRKLMENHFQNDFTKLRDPFFKEIDACIPNDNGVPATDAEKKKIFELAPTFSGKAYTATALPANLHGCSDANLQHDCERHLGAVQTMKPTALYDENDPILDHRKTTSFWPEDMTEAEVSAAMQAALNQLAAAGHVPSAADFATHGKTYIKVPGTNPPNWPAVVVNGVTVKFGFNLNSGQVTIDQFFPTGGTDVKKLKHKEMHAVRRSLEMP